MINLKLHISLFLGAMLSLLSPPAFAQNVQEIPIDTVRFPGEGPVRSLMLQKGYADTVCLAHYKNAAISKVQGTCDLVLADTQTVRFRCLSFKYTKGTGSGLPNQNKMPLDIRLYNTGITSDSLLSIFRWYIDGTGTVYEDSAIHHPTTLILPPGSYLLSYGGYMANTAVADTTEILNINSDDGIGLSVQPSRTTIAPIEHSTVTLILESLPLLQKTVKGWNAVTTYTSHDGTDENGDTLTACYDDFGRTSVSISRKMSPKGSDLVTVQQYDGFGRKARQWLPFTSAAGLTVDSLVKINRFPVGGADYPDKEPFTLTEYEPSPLSRPTVEYGAGADWHSHAKGISSNYLVNISGNDTLGCRNLTITYPGGRAQVQSSGEYATGTLQVLCTKDEDGNKQFTFSDRSNRTVLVRRMLHEGGLQKALDTYYLYDGFDNLLAVLPPAASAVLKGGSVEWTALYKYAILYHYDNRDRLKAKKLPGCGWTSFVYDENDRLVLTQTAELKKQGRALFTLCDSLGRVCISGTCSFSLAPGYSIPAGTCCHYEGKSGTLAGYTATGITLINAKVMTASYYDNYNFLNDLCNRSVLPKASLLYGHEAEFCSGLQTGGMQAVLDPANAGNTKCLYTVTKYDYRARPSRAETENLTGGYDTEDTEYDFLGRVTRRHLTHYVPAPKVNLSEDYTYHYDRAGRVLTVSHSVNGGKAHTLTANQYDEPGRLSRRAANGNARLAVSYSYNVRSWPTRIASPVFEERLSYNQAQGTTQPRFNGNISSLEWRIRYSDATHKDFKARIYNFSYDNLNRLTEADYQEARETNNHYTTRYEYDAMGNLLTLRRNGLHNNGTYEETDNLICTYNGNQLVKADDSATDPVYKDCFTFRDGADEEVEYEYDENGNLTKDLNRGICKIQYNVLNLPSRVDFRDGSHITYIYNGGCHKLRTDYYINTLTIIMPLPILYTGTAGRRNLVHTWTTNCSNLVLENDTLKMSLFDGGYVSYPRQETSLDATYSNDKKPAWHYYLKDHLGSNRVVMSASGTPEQINHYYPYGGLMGESLNITSSQRYKYNGKELDRVHGLDWYDYGARMYDAALARWTTVDPMAEKYPDVSPYVYCHDNPMNAVDLDGRDDYYSTLGQFLFKDNKKTDHIIIRNTLQYNIQKSGWKYSKNSDIPIEKTLLSADAYSKIFTNILYRNMNLSLFRLTDGKIQVAKSPDDFNVDKDHTENIPVISDGANAETFTDDKSDIFSVTAIINYECLQENRYMFSTVSNVVNLLGIHEYTGHGLLKLHEKDIKSHIKVYEMQMASPSFKMATPLFRKEIKKHYLNLLNKNRK